MDGRKNRWLRRVLIILMLLFIISLIGEAMRDPHVRRHAQYFLGVAMVGVASLVAVMCVAVAFWGAS